jgi:hypothetical protein
MAVRPVVAAIVVAVLAVALCTTISGDAQPGQVVYVPRQ